MNNNYAPCLPSWRIVQEIYRKFYVIHKAIKLQKFYNTVHQFRFIHFSCQHSCHCVKPIAAVHLGSWQSLSLYRSVIRYAVRLPVVMQSANRRPKVRQVYLSHGTVQQCIGNDRAWSLPVNILQIQYNSLTLHGLYFLIRARINKLHSQLNDMWNLVHTIFSPL